MKTFFTPWTIAFYFVLLIFGLVSVIYAVTGNPSAGNAMGGIVLLTGMLGFGWVVKTMM